MEHFQTFYVVGFKHVMDVVSCKYNAINIKNAYVTLFCSFYCAINEAPIVFKSTF